MGLPIDKSYLLRNIRSFKSVILDPAYIIQYATLPVASEDYEGIIYQYTGSASGMTLGGFYQCQEITPSTSPKTYHWVEITTKTAIDGVTIRENANDEIYVVDATSLAKGIIKLGSGLSTDANGATNVVDRVIIASLMPTAAAALDGNVYLYCGTTTTTAPIYQKGYLYKCQESSTTGVYEFVQIGLHADEETIHTAADGELSVDEAYKKIWIGHKEDWDLLTTAEKTAYDEAHFTDDEPSVDNDLYQKKDLTTPLTIGGTQQTTVEGALGGFYGLLTQEPIGSYNFSTGGNNYQWLDLGTSPNTSNSQAFLLFEITYGRIDASQTKAFIACSGTMADANYIDVYNFTNAQTYTNEQFIIDNNKHVWFGMQSYCYAHIKVYGRWTGFGDTSLSTPTGTSLTVKRTLSTADLTSTVTSGSTAPITSGAFYPIETDLSSYLSDGWSVREYVKGYKTGNMVIIDFGGLKRTSDTNANRNQYVMQNLPYSIKNRAVTTLFSDETDNFKKVTVYVVDNAGVIVSDLRANFPFISASVDNFYGQMILVLN